MQTQTLEKREDIKTLSKEREPMNHISFDEDTLVNLSLFEQEKTNIPNIRIALITDNEDLKKLNYYLLKDVGDVDYFTMDDNAIDLEIIEDMDIVIFSKDDDQQKHAILERIKAKNLKTKFMMISDKPYLRQKDILQEHINGVDKLMKMDFFLEEYILSIEKYLHSNFYSRRVLDIEDLPDVLIHEKKLFQKRVDDLMQRKIYFSILKYSYQSEIDIDEYNIRKIVREHDTILVDKENQKIVFLLMNVIPEFGAQIIKKRIDNFSITLTPENTCNAFDMIFEEDTTVTV